MRPSLTSAAFRRTSTSVSSRIDPQPGDWVVIHVGFALQKIDEAQAEATLKVLAEVAQSGARSATAAGAAA